jgi:hypothetical protein
MQGAERLDEEGAEAVAGLAVMARGEGAPGTTAAECRVVSPGFMADVHGVRQWVSSNKYRGRVKLTHTTCLFLAEPLGHVRAFHRGCGLWAVWKASGAQRVRRNSTGSRIGSTAVHPMYQYLTGRRVHAR